MEKFLKLGCLVLERQVEKKVQHSIEKLNFGIKVFTYKNFNQLMNDIDKEQIDYVFVDINANKDDLLSFLKRVQSEFPHVVRILLSDTFSHDLVLMTNDIIHLILEKKNLEQNLKTLFIKADKFRQLLTSPELIKMTNAFNNLVVLKPQYMEILQQINRQDSSNKVLCDLIEKNLALSTKVLQVANMTTFAPLKRIQSIGNAVFFIGSNVLRALILNMQVYGIDAGKGNVFRYLAALEKHCYNVAVCSKTIANQFNVSKSISNDCFTAGLLHDIGKLVIMDKVHNWDSIQKLADESDLTIWKAEEAFLGTNHAKIGAYFLGIWNFSDEIIDAVAFHHNPSDCDDKGITPLTFVHIAEAMLRKDQTTTLEEFEKQLDLEYLETLGIKEQTMNYYKSYLGLNDQPDTFGIELAELENNLPIGIETIDTEPKRIKSGKIEIIDT